MNDFSAKTLKALALQGIRVIRLASVPETDMRFYVLDDNGCHRIRSHREVLAIAAGTP